MTSLSLASFLLCRVFTSEKVESLRINHLVYACGLSGYNCSSHFFSSQLRMEKVPSPDLPLLSPTSWKRPRVLHLLSTFKIPLHHSLRMMLPWANLSPIAPPSWFSIKGRQSHCRSREAEINPETNSSHAET